VKKLIAFVAAIAILAFAATGTASARSSAKAPTLAQFNALNKKVTKLQKQVNLLERGLNAAFAYDVCLTSATADAFQGTWIWTNKISSVFPSTSTGAAAVNDLQACSAFRIQRQLASADTPPSTAVFSALTGLFQ
jgi:ABC-type amino acid transport substrate-binding protein